VKIVACAAAVAMLGAAQAAQAGQVIDWTISGGAFDDGGAFSGTFTWDVSSASITDWNVVTTGGTTRAGDTYSTTSFPFGGAFGGDVLEVGFFHGTFAFPIFAPFAGPEVDLTNLAASSAGTISALTGTEYDFVIDFPFGGTSISNVRNITAGSAVGVLETTGVPEPAAWSLMILGAGLTGAALRRRRTPATA
jgi:hypothetical protein